MASCSRLKSKATCRGCPAFSKDLFEGARATSAGCPTTATRFSLFQGVVYDGMNDSSKLIPIFASLARWLIFTEAFLDTACGR
jgi:hypothetical protein